MSKQQGLLDWIDARFPLTSTWKAHVSEYYAPKNFNFWYFFGSLALLVGDSGGNRYFPDHELQA